MTLQRNGKKQTGSYVMNRRVSAKSRPEIRKAQLAGPVKTGVKVSMNIAETRREERISSAMGDHTAIDGSSPYAAYRYEVRSRL